MSVKRHRGTYLGMCLILLNLAPLAPAKRIIYVDALANGRNRGTSWVDAFQNLSLALDEEPGAGDEIRVAQGVYRPPGADRAESFDLRKASGATIRGGYAGLARPENPDAWDIEAFPTTLSGDLHDDDNDDNDEPDFQHNADNCYHVITGGGTDTTTLLEGFIIRGGHAYGPSPEEQNGGGLYNDGARLTIRDCRFVGNACRNNGGALFNQGNSAPTLLRCRFSANRAANGGAAYSIDSRPAFRACRFSGNQAGNEGGALCHNNSHAELVGCAFFGNQAGDGGGVYNELSHPSLTNCLFSGNRAELGGGLYNFESNPRLTNCTLSRNTAEDFGGGLYNSYASPLLTNCILWANRDAGGTDEEAQLHTADGAPVVRHCCIQDCRRFGAGPGNTDEYPRFVDDDGPDGDPRSENVKLALRWGSPCIDAGDNQALPFVTFDFEGNEKPAGPISFDYGGAPRVCNGIVDMGAFEFGDSAPGTVIYVDARAPQGGDGSSWAKALASLQTALARADEYKEDGQTRQIWVAAGTYAPAEPNGPRDASFQLVSNVKVYGGFAGSETPLAERDPNRYVTTLSGDLHYRGGPQQDANVADPCDLLHEPTRSDNCYHVVTGSGTDATAVLDGFTITGGTANGALSSDTSGGGIYIRAGSPTLCGCTFRDNAATACGGGVYCRSSAATLRACTIRRNGADNGGGLYCDNSSPTIQDSTIVDNYAAVDGGGIACAEQSAPLIERNTICGNRAPADGAGGGGIGCLEKSSPRILRNTITGNTAFDGAGIYCRGADPSILDNMIIANTAADDGGGICALQDARPTIRNNTIVRNQADPCGGIYFDGAHAIVTNCILWENGDDFHNWTPENDCNATYSCIQDRDAGTGNISIYPYFADPEHGDYHLKSYSSCIDAGKGGQATIDLVLSGEVDFDGKPRVNNLLVDMGAYETYEPNSWKVFRDLDRDGLPDGWETEHFGGLQAGPADDPDGDGYSNLTEYQRGAKPKFAQKFIYVRRADPADPQADGSLEHPFTSIQHAIDEAIGGAVEEAIPGTSILVTAGTFCERLTIDSKVLFIDGGYDNDFTQVVGTTTLDAERKGRGILYINVPGGQLTGFTITHGYEKDGGGMYLHESSPTIQRNIIEGNHAWQDGGGVSFYGQSRPLFADNTVRDNQADDNAGAIFCREADPNILRCTITGNMAGDNGGALRVRGDVELRLTDCTITGNTAGDEGGAIICREPRPDEGVLYTSDPAIDRSRVDLGVARSTNCRGGLVLRPYCRATLIDSILRGNTPPGLWVSHSEIQIEGIVKTFDGDWMNDVNMVGEGQLQTGPEAVLQMDNCRLRCNLTGSGTIEVDPQAELRIEGAARVDLATDPQKKGTIWCHGLLYVGDAAQVTGAEIYVSRARFVDDVNITNSIIHAEAGVPYGQFFVADDVNIADSEIHADGDRYMDLDPSVFRGLIERNRIFVEITEGIGHTRGGMFELRGLDLYRDPNAPPGQFLYPCQVPDFNTVTWTIEELKLAPGAKLNLTNRFDFQGQGGEDEVLYVRHLVLGPNSVLNTAFNRVYYETKDADESATVESVPLLGFSLNNIAFDRADEFAVRVMTNNTVYENEKLTQHNLIGVRRITDPEWDPCGLMEMRNLKDTNPDAPTCAQVIPARAKGLFAKSNEPRIQIRFEYLFRSPIGGEVVIYLSDTPEPPGHDDPNRIEVARLPQPPTDRPGGAPESGQWGIFEQVVPVGDLDFVRGTRIELELLGPAGTCVWINNWDPGIHCTTHVCGDVAWARYQVDEKDFLAALSECGRRLDAVKPSEEGENAGCLDGYFCADGYVTVHDALAVEWARKRTNLCSEPPPAPDPAFLACAGPAALTGPAPAGAGLKPALASAVVQAQARAPLPEIQGRFLLAAKRYLHREGMDEIDDFLSERLYGLDSRGNLVDGPFPTVSDDHFNGRLVRDPAGGLYQLNLELGLVRLADDTVIVGPDSFRHDQPLRHGASAVVHVGFTGDDGCRPLLDAAFDEDKQGYLLYVVPVMVDAPDGTHYAATARLRPDTKGPQPSYHLEQILDDWPPAGDNQDTNQLREVEVDEAGNVYVLNCHYRNRGDILWVYYPDGSCRRAELQRLGISAPVGLCVSSHDPNQLYLSSAENEPNAKSTKIYVLSTADLSLKPSIEVDNLGHITDITEDPGDGTLCVVGFYMPEIPRESDLAGWSTAILHKTPFYRPCFATIPYGDTGPVAACCLSEVTVPGDAALPLSVIGTGRQENGVASIAAPTGRTP